MRTVRISITALLFLAIGGVYAQTGKPLMKITVKDGVVVKTESLDANKNGYSSSPSTSRVSNSGTRTTNESGAPSISPIGPYRSNSSAGSSNETTPSVSGQNAIDNEQSEALAHRREVVMSSDVISKGTSQPERVEYASLVFDGTGQVITIDGNPNKPDVVSPSITQTIMSQTFEGVWPGSTGWSAYAASGAASAYWDDVNFRAYAGSWSAWCAASGGGAVYPTYADNMNTWMRYGPVSLTDATAASLTFKHWINSESGFDKFYWLVSTDGSNYYGYSTSGNSGGWVSRSLDLSAVPTLGDVRGQSQVWIAMVFITDVSVHSYEGSYVDDVLLTKDVIALPNLEWTTMALTTDVWASGATVTATLTEENNGTASATSHYSRIYMSTNDIISDIDTQLGADILYTSITNGSSQSKNLSFTVPPGSTGTYYLGALVDYYGNVAESNEADNGGTRTGTVEVVSYPDLTCPSIGLSETTWAAGQSITATVVDKNNGPGNAGSHHTRLYLSEDNIISISDDQLGGDLSFGPLSSGISQSVDESFTVPSVVDGVYYVGAIVDYYGAVQETTEANNIVYRISPINVLTPTDKDLYGVSMGLSSYTWAIGTEVTAYFTEGNIGTGTAGAHDTRLYLSPDIFMVDGQDLLLAEVSFGSISAGDEQMQPSTFTVPSVTSGDYYIGTLIDIYNVVEETNENNAGYLNVVIPVVPNLPDLIWTTITIIDDDFVWDEGATINAQLTVSNLGGAGAGAHDSRMYLSTNNIISGSDVLLGGDMSFSSIAALDEQTQATSFTVPDDGVYWLGALVDVYGEVAESDEGNNGGAGGQVTIESTNPDYKDLIPYNTTLSSDTWVVGSTVEATHTEKNEGTLTAEAHTSRFYLSDNTVITESDTELSDVSLEACLPGDFVVGTTSWTAPDVVSGVYYLGVMVDVNDEVDESDESNNIQYRNGTLTLVNDIADIGVNPTSVTINEPELEASGALPRRAAAAGAGKDSFAPNQMIIKFKTSVGSNMRAMATADKGLEALNAKYKVSQVKPLGRQTSQLAATAGNGMMVIRFDAMTDLQAALAEYRALSIVEFAEPDYILTNNADKDFTPTDPMFDDQWGLKNTGNAVSYSGQTVGSAGEDINIESAWDITKGSSSIIVAVIDDGVDLSHAEFAGRLVDGYDFVNGDEDPNPLSADGHGNACAGIIGAADDGVGTVGVAPGIKIMPLKAMEDGSGYHSDIIDAIYFAVGNGAKVISMSLGGTSPSISFETAVNYAVANGVVVLAAAGNDNVDNLVTPHYPASYASVISVGAMSPCGLRKTPSTCDGEFWWGSNYGNLSIITPGTRIFTTDVSGAAGYSATDYMTNFNGTSAATPFAAGVAALILSVDPSLTPAEVRQIMQASAVDVGDEGYDANNGYGRVNAYAALQLLEGSAGTELVTITNEGEGILTISEITDDQPWLSLSGISTPIELSAGESAVLTLSVDWDLVPITSSGQVTIASNDADESSVFVDVTANPSDVETFAISAEAIPVAGGTVSGDGGYSAGQTAMLVASPNPHYTFTTWTDNGSEVSSNSEYSFTVTGNRHLVANFVSTEHTISATANPEDAGTVQGGGEFTVNEEVTLTAEPLGEYSFVNWTEDDEVVSTEASYTFNVTGSRTLIANFAVEFYAIDVTVDPLDAGTTTGAGSYTAGQTASLTAIPAAGFQFESWTEDGNVVSTDANFIFSVTANRSLVAQFEIATYNVTVTVNPLNAGSVTGADVYQHGQTVNLEATPAADYDFVNWTVGGSEVSTNPIYSFTITADVELAANFVSTVYTISVSANPVDAGIVLGGGEFSANEEVTLTAEPLGEYSFVNWTEGNEVVSAEASYTFNVTGSRTLVANFAVEFYTIDVTVDPLDGGTITGAGSFTAGQTASLTAIPASGFQFKSWSEDGNVVSNDANYIFVVTADRSLVAQFDLATHTVLATVDPPNSGSVTGADVYQYGQTVNLEATPATGYDFVNWTVAGSEVSANPIYSFTVTADMELVANFVAIVYTISASANPEEAGIVQGGGEFTINEEVTLTAEPLGEYSFVNWTEDNVMVSTEATYTFNVTASRALVANFAVSFYTVDISVDPLDAGTTTGGGAYTPGQTASLNAIPATGFQFESWKEDGNVVSTDANYVFSVTANRSLVAQFEIATHNVTVTVNPPNSGSVAGADIYQYGQTANLEATPATDYAFVNWTVDGGEVSTNPTLSFTVTFDVDLVANFQRTQTITFNPLDPAAYGDPDFLLIAEASSQLTVKFTSSDPGILEIDGNTATIVGAGTVEVTASQPGDSEFLPAEPVTQSLIVDKAAQLIIFGGLSSLPFNSPPMTLGGYSTSGLTVTYESSNLAVATITDDTAVPTAMGTTTITASQAGDDHYHAATPVSQELQITRSTQTITFEEPAAYTYGDDPFDVTPTSTSGLTVTISSSDEQVATVSNNTVTIVGAGSTTLTATQEGDESFEAAAPVAHVLFVDKATQVITFDLLGPILYSDEPLMLIATSDSELPVTYESSDPTVAIIVDNAVVPTGVGTTTITASQPGDTNYYPADAVLAELQVNKGTQAITFEELTSRTYGDLPFDVFATASSQLSVTFTSSNTDVATVSNNTITIVGAGSADITASQEGNDLFEAAEPIVHTLVINKAEQVITFDPLNPIPINDPPLALGGVSSSGLAVTYESSNTGVASINGDTAIPVGIGSTTITATQSGNENYYAAASASQELEVTKASQSITFDEPGPHTFGDLPFDVTPAASSTLHVVITSSNPEVATIFTHTIAIVGAGTTTLTATQDGDNYYAAAQPVSVTLVVDKAGQVIAFDALGPIKYTDAPVTLTANSNSGLPVTYDNSNPTVAVIVDNTVGPTGVGTTTITANQPGDANHYAAEPVSHLLIVSKGIQTIGFEGPASHTFGDMPFDVVASASSNLAVSFASADPAVATVSGNTITIVGAGSTMLTAMQGGNDLYEPAESVDRILIVDKAFQDITFGPLSTITINDAPFALDATASSGLIVTYESSSEAVAVVNGNMVSPTGLGTTSITARQIGNGNYQAAGPVSQELVVIKGSQTITFNAITSKTFGDPAFDVTATTSSGLPVTISSSNTEVATVSNGNHITIVGAGSTTLTAWQDGNGFFFAAQTVDQVLVVDKAGQSIAFGALNAIKFSDPALTLSGTASSGLPVTFDSSNGTIAIINGNSVIQMGVGTAMITAKQSGNANYYPATDVTQQLVVTKGTQVITFQAPPTHTFGDADFDITASSDVGLPVTFTSSNQTVATVSGNTITIVGAGTSVLTAVQTGNTEYEAAPSVTRTLVINKATQELTFTLTPEMKFSPSTMNLTGVSSSGLPVTYQSSNTAVATIVSNVLTRQGVGVTNITASQNGNANYKAATSVTVSLRVIKGDQEITFGAVADRIETDGDFDLQVSVSSGLLPQLTISDPSRVKIEGGRTVRVLLPGSITIQATQSGNANYNAAVTVSRTFCIKPRKPTITVDDNGGGGLPILTSSSAIGNKWYRNGVLIAGATGSTYETKKSDPQGYGMYTVQVQVDDCISVLSDEERVLVMGFEELASSLLTIYPNPFVNEVHIDVSAFALTSPATVTMLDGLGRTQRTGTGTGVIRLDVTDLPSGGYMLQIEVEDGVVTRRVVKVR